MAKKSLVVVESPTKVKTIQKFLDKNFIVKPTMGHVKDLPKSKLGIDITNGFKPQYVRIKSRMKILSELKKVVKDCSRLYLATDPDREGEAIGWHVANELSMSEKDVYRVLFNEITEKAVKEAFKSPGRLDINKTNSQQARRILDRLVGYQISPLLWQKVKRGLSAGRVQSVATRFICDREDIINNFIKKEYWTIAAKLEGKYPPSFDAYLKERNSEKISLNSKDNVDDILNYLEGKEFFVDSIEKSEKKRYPMPPFITSTLQQEAARKLHFTAKKTMLIAQQLYEGIEIKDGSVALITYMRTDSVRVSMDSQKEARSYILNKYGEKNIPSSPPIYKSKKTAQEAHEAIRPTSISIEPGSIKEYLSRDQMALYKLIWERFLASQMNPAIFDFTAVIIKAGECSFRATGSIIKFRGFMTVYQEVLELTENENGNGNDEKKEDKERMLPHLEIGEKLKLIEFLPQQHFTQPPPRYTEATLIKDLEEKGIGRPSTYATILSTIQERGYVKKEKGYLFPTELGNLINGMLVKGFPDIVDIQFTAQMEDSLDSIEEGNENWVAVIENFYEKFLEDLKRAEQEMKNLKKEGEPTDITCDICGAPMVMKWGRYGKFLACSAFPNCKNTKPINNSEKEGGKEILTEEICEKCGKNMVLKEGRFGKFYSCPDYPQCKYTKPYTTSFICPEKDCSGNLVERKSKKNRIYYSCSNYPQCKYILWDKPLEEPCPSCHAPFLIVKMSKSGQKHIKCINKSCKYSRKEEERIQHTGNIGGL